LSGFAVPSEAAILSFRETSFRMLDGSLSGPSGSERATWFVPKTPMDISRVQIDNFAKIYRASARPIEQNDGRIVKGSR
jgi:carbonic anhydrase